FEQFDLPTGSTAIFNLEDTNFDNVRNILNRVTQGNPSEINGLIEVLGGNNPNLYLLNPSGIIFGSQASLNIPADFTVSTATQLDFGNNSWLESSQTSDYSNFDGLPTAFGFNAANGTIINAADLAVGTNQNLNFLATTVINTGTLTAPAGSITVTAVPGINTVRLSQPGSLLSLEFEPSLNGGTSISALDLADLLTDVDPAISGVDFELDLAIENDLIKTATEIILPSETGLVINEGSLSLGSGSLNVIGNKVAFLAGEITGNRLDIQAIESFFAAPGTDLLQQMATLRLMRIRLMFMVL
ncbi:MAG: filamentous hemagglutinin N-terminal domain-containing protein, partial [Limnothrix sp. RL_2_0]|nr:filamentous hemagglutinin N-terminal domain-containing protein [Limnothrix sp. RL_2_0]